MADDDGAIDVRDPRVVSCIERYWRTNIRIMTCLLGLWAVGGLGAGVLFADVLNRFQLGGFPLGFWFAQQGSIILFVVLILLYALLLNRLDAKHHTELERLRGPAPLVEPDGNGEERGRGGTRGGAGSGGSD